MHQEVVDLTSFAKDISLSAKEMHHFLCIYRITKWHSLCWLRPTLFPTPLNRPFKHQTLHREIREGRVFSNLPMLESGTFWLLFNAIFTIQVYFQGNLYWWKQVDWHCWPFPLNVLDAWLLCWTNCFITLGHWPGTCLQSGSLALLSFYCLHAYSV